MKNTLNDVMSKEEFVAAFKNVVDRVKRVEAKLTEDFSTLVKTINTKIDARLAEITNGIDGKDGAPGRDGRDGIDGLNADEERVTTTVLERIKLPEQKEIILDKPEDIRNKLEVLQGDERLKAEAISGLEALIADIKTLKSRPNVLPGRSLLQLYVNGTKRGAVQYLNITGTGVSYASSNGRNDVTITGGGALAVLTATGTVNDSNLTFTFASTPTLVVVNGATYRNGAGCTIVTTTVTLNNPVGSGGDIYGLG